MTPEYAYPADGWICPGMGPGKKTGRKLLKSRWTGQALDGKITMVERMGKRMRCAGRMEAGISDHFERGGL